MPLTVTFDDKELPELRRVLDRAMGTLEPQRWPDWLAQLSDAVDQRTTGQAIRPFNARQEAGL